MLLADRFTTDPDQEDLGILFQVWACKSFTKSVPLYVQTIRESTVRQIAPFLDLGQDVIVSMEQTRFRLLALSAVCPGASTLMCNLLKSSAVRKPKRREPTLAGRRWLRGYVNGCDFRFLEVPVQAHHVGQRFVEVAEWLYWASGYVLAGLIDGASEAVRLNPAQEHLVPGTTLLVIGSSKAEVLAAMAAPFTPISDRLKEQLQRRAGGNPSGGQPAPEVTEHPSVPSSERNGRDSEGVDLEEGQAAGRKVRWEEELVLCEDPWREGGGAAANHGSDTDGDVDTEESIHQRRGGNSSDDDGSEGCVFPEVVQQLSDPQQIKALVQRELDGPESASIQTTERAAARQSVTDEGYRDDIARGVATESWDEGTFPADAATVRQTQQEDSSSSSSSSSGGSPFTGHFILCGASRNVVPFMEHLRRAEPSRQVPIVVLAVHPPEDLSLANDRYGPIHFVKGSAADSASLRAAGAATAKALVYLARSSRPVKTAQGTGGGVNQERSTREAVLADADALLACYGVGEESGNELTHTVVELLFTTSIEFLQPGLLLKGVNVIYDEGALDAGQPRKSWQMRAWQQREAVAEGLAEWQANPYFAAGRVTVPALMDTFATQCFFNRGMLVDLVAELCGDFGNGTGGDGRNEGALLQQIPLPRGLWGRTYGDCFMTLAVSRNLIALGLYRRKSENPATRLHYVVANPPWDEVLEATDRVFVLRERV